MAVGRDRTFGGARPRRPEDAHADRLRRVRGRTPPRSLRPRGLGLRSSTPSRRPYGPRRRICS